MSPKTKAAPAKPNTKEAKPKAEKSNKKAGKEIAPEAELEAGPASADGVPVDLDELEEAQDAEDAAAAAGSGGGSSNDAALAAASGSGEMSASFKNFRHHPDMENFYRFIYENDLRHEALAIIDDVLTDKAQRRAMGSGKTAKGAH
ncbi:hypothetical protein WDW37_12075 [Bdellovibrionota bacterium FG-1]